LAVRVRRADRPREHRVASAVATADPQEMLARHQEDIVEPHALLPWRSADVRGPAAGAVVVGDLVDLVADHLEAPQLRLAGDVEAEEVFLVAAEPALDPIVGGHAAGEPDRVVGFGLGAGGDRPLLLQRDPVSRSRPGPAHAE